MDIGLILTIIQQLFNYAIGKLAEYTSSFNDIQWFLLIGGGALVAIALYAAWKSYRPMSYKLSISIAKLGLTMIVLAFAWPYACELYNTAVQYTGNPVYGFIAIILGSFLGYNIAMLILSSMVKKK